MFDPFFAGFSTLMDPYALFFTIFGVVLGIIFGATPGLTVSMGMVFMLPITFNLSMVNAMALLCGLYVGGTSGGLITAILLNIPGTPASIATTFDGFPMTQRGEGGKALGIGIICSFIGALVSFSLLFLVSKPLSRIALRFTPFDYFGIILFSITLIGGLAGKSILKGLVSALFGMVMATFGTAPIDGFPRFNFGWRELDAGFHLLPCLIGIYAVTEILKNSERKSDIDEFIQQSVVLKGFGFSLAEFTSQIPNLIRSILIGIGIGTLPGLGAGQSNIIAYSVAKRRSKYPEKFGTGIIDGIVASESANNAVIGGAMIPTLTMGIPGDSATAMLLAGFMIHGLSPGPMLMTTNAALVYTIFAALFVANFVMVGVEYYGMRVFLQLLRIPKFYILPPIMVLCVVGAFGINNRIFDVLSIGVFAIIGYSFHRFDYPTAPFILGFILAPILELNLRRGLLVSQGSYVEFFTNPVSGFFIALTFVSLGVMAFRKVNSGMRQSEELNRDE